MKLSEHRILLKAMYFCQRKTSEAFSTTLPLAKKKNKKQKKQKTHLRGSK